MKKLLPCILGLMTLVLQAQRDWDRVEIQVEQLTENIFVLFGAGGNIGLAVGEEAVYMIDDQYAPLTDKILSAVRKITDKPIRYLVNTHWHGDHTGGNGNFGKAGTIIVAHEAVRKRMGSLQERSGGRVSQPSPFIALPQITYVEEMSIHLDSLRSMQIMHVDPSHTDGDSYIYFPYDNVIHMGDNFSNGGYPYIDLASGGDVDGLIRNLNMVLFMLDDETRIIPGHGPVTDKARLQEYRDMVFTIRSRINQAKGAGHSLGEIQKMGLTKEWDDEFGQGFIDSGEITESIYLSLD